MALLMRFRKGDQARWLGHLDLMRMFEKAVRMSKVEVAYTQGFNPRVKMSIASALPLGATADDEMLTLYMTSVSEPAGIVKRLNRALPEGLSIHAARVLPERARSPIPTASEFVVEIEFPDAASAGCLDNAVSELLAAPEIPWQRESGKTSKRIDLRPGIASLKVLDRPTETTARLTMILPHRQFTVKPSEIVGAIAQRIPGTAQRSVRRLRLITDN